MLASDGDGSADAEDPEGCSAIDLQGGLAPEQAVPSVANTTAFEICDNFFDDDGDGLTDMVDTSDCPTGMELPVEGNITGEPLAPTTTTAFEICDNFFDDDGDGSADAEDPEGCSLSTGGENGTSSEGFGDSPTSGSILPPEAHPFTEDITDSFSNGTVPGFGDVKVPNVKAVNG